MSGKPTVSVIIPTYNRCALLMRALESALGQTFQDIEVIVADDGSTDGTGEMLRALQDPRVRYVHLSHGGACAARNAGMALAEGRYIAFLDSDDVWRKDKLKRQLSQLQASGADVVCCAFLRHEAASPRQERYPGEQEKEARIDAQRLLGGNIVSTQTLLGRAECMRQVGFDERFPRMQDWDFAIRVAQTCHLRYFPEELVDTYIQPDSISSKPALGLQAMRLLCQKYHRELEASMPNTLVMLNALRSYAQACGESCARDYRKALSPRRSFMDNCRLVKGGVASLLRDRHHVRKASSR